VSDDRDDEDLRTAFAGLRAADRARTPRYRIEPRPGPAAGRPLRPALVGLLVAAGLAAVLVLRPGPPPPAPPPSLAEWRSPTEFLLRTPAQELLYTVPRLGQGLPADAVKGGVP
jgi:hypothetical protein